MSTLTEACESYASENAAPGSRADVLDELRDAAARKWRGDPAAQRAGLFARAAGEVQQLRAEVAELDALRERMAKLLRRTAVALRGPEPPLTRWSWDDLPERAAAAVAAERERCARLADAYASDGTTAWQQHFAWCAADIRRGPENQWRAQPHDDLPVRQPVDRGVRPALWAANARGDCLYYEADTGRDVMLRLDGNWRNDAERLTYTDALLKTLNGMHVVADRNWLAEIEKDADRYRWLKSRQGLTLRSKKQPNVWTRTDGTEFCATHFLAEGGMQHGPADSLDATVDAAMLADRIRDA